MSAFKKGLLLVLSGGFLAAIISTIAFPQGAVTLVQIILGSTAVSNSNPLPVTVTSGGGGSIVDQTAWTNGTSTFVPNGGVFNDSATALTSGNEGTVRLNANREMHVTCDSGNTLCGLISAPIVAGTNVIGKVGIDQTTPGTTNLVALAANQSVNVAQFGGVSTATGQVAVSVAPVTATNTALVVDLRPDSPGIIALGPAADTSAVPTVLTPTGNSNSGITPVVGGSAISSLVLKASAGSLYSTYANCTSACWLMVFNATSAPANGATTAGTASGNMTECIPIGAGSIGGLNYGPGPPAVYSVGITVAISSTACSTLTLSTVAMIHGMVK
jgi:hypothetical protein